MSKINLQGLNFPGKFKDSTLKQNGEDILAGLFSLPMIENKKSIASEFVFPSQYFNKIIAFY